MSGSVFGLERGASKKNAPQAASGTRPTGPLFFFLEARPLRTWPSIHSLSSALASRSHRLSVNPLPFLLKHDPQHSQALRGHRASLGREQGMARFRSSFCPRQPPKPSNSSNPLVIPSLPFSRIALYSSPSNTPMSGRCTRRPKPLFGLLKVRSRSAPLFLLLTSHIP